MRNLINNDKFQFLVGDYSHMAYLKGGTTITELNYQKGTIQNGNNFEICVTAESSSLRYCAIDYDSSEKKPEYVTASLYGDHGRSYEEPSQSQSQAQNSSDTNAQSQSQTINLS